MAKVAIVILNWNGQKMLAKYLPNVIEYSRQDAEIGWQTILLLMVRCTLRRLSFLR